MSINFAHVRVPAAAGGWISYALFEAKAATGLRADNALLLGDLTLRVRKQGLRVDQSALAFVENGRITFQGSAPLVEHLSRAGLPQWTHTLNV